MTADELNKIGKDYEDLVIGVMGSPEYMYLDEFLYHAIFQPPGAEPLPPRSC